MSETIDPNIMKNKLVNLFNNNTTNICSGLPQQVNKHRQNAVDLFNNNGIPAKGTEKYKYTDLMRAFGKRYGYSFVSPNTLVEPKTVFKCAVPDIDTHTILLENGWYYKRNNNEAQLPTNVVVLSLRDAAHQYPQMFDKYYNTIADNLGNSTTALNTAFAQDGFFIYIPDGVLVEKPIQIINLLRGTNPLLVNQRNLVIAGKNSNCKIIICDHTLSHHDFFANSVTELFANDNATIDYYKIQNQHNKSSQISSLYIHQNTYSNVLTNTLTLHGGFVRNNVNIKLAGQFAEAHVYGLAIMDSTQHVDNYTFIDHAVPNCQSNEMYKNILDDDATGAFNGRILVRPDAQKTQAFQSNKNICLTPTAKFYTKPQLEIYADDVKCSHGATVGQIDNDALFYLKSRGIGGREARMMLMFAFAFEVLRNIRVPVLTERYADLVEKRLRGEFSKCEGCFVHCS